MFLSAGAVPGATWIDETIAFTEKTGADERAAVFAAEARLRRSAAPRVLSARSRSRA